MRLSTALLLIIKKIMKTVCINLLVSVTQCPQVLPLLTSISNLNVGSWNLLSSKNWMGKNMTLALFLWTCPCLKKYTSAYFEFYTKCWCTKSSTNINEKFALPIMKMPKYLKMNLWLQVEYLQYENSTITILHLSCSLIIHIKIHRLIWNALAVWICHCTQEFYFLH